MRYKRLIACSAGAAAIAAAFTVPASIAADGEATTDPSAAEQSETATSTDDELELQPVPDDAPIRIAATAGAGDSDVLTFSPGAEHFTFLVTCLSESSGPPATLKVVDVTDPEIAVPVRCDSGRQAVTFNAGSNQTEKFRLEAPPAAQWEMSVYTGMPDNVSID